MFPADRAHRAAMIDDNRRAIDEAAALGSPCLVLVVGGLPQFSRPGSVSSHDIADAREEVAAAIAQLLEPARAAGVPLAIEPLHPMYAADRACVNTLGQALDICERLDPDGAHRLGVVIDVYHVWWDPDVLAGIKRAGTAKRIHAFHISRLAGADTRPASRPRHDGRRHDRDSKGSAELSKRRGSPAPAKWRSSRTTGGHGRSTRFSPLSSTAIAPSADPLRCLSARAAVSPQPGFQYARFPLRLHP